MTDTLASALIAGAGVLVSVLIALDSRRHTKEANRIAQQNADKANATIQATARDSNEKLDRANSLTDVANQKLEDANEIGRTSTAQLIESNRLMAETLRIQREQLELEKAKDSARLRLDEPRWYLAHSGIKPTSFVPSVTIRCVGRDCRIERVCVISKQGRPVMDLNARRHGHTGYETVLDPDIGGEFASIVISTGNSLPLHGWPPVSENNYDEEGLLDATRLEVQTACGEVFQCDIQSLREYVTRFVNSAAVKVKVPPQLDTTTE